MIFRSNFGDPQNNDEKSRIFAWESLKVPFRTRSQLREISTNYFLRVGSPIIFLFLMLFYAIFIYILFDVCVNLCDQELSWISFSFQCVSYFPLPSMLLVRFSNRIQLNIFFLNQKQKIICEWMTYVIFCYFPMNFSNEFFFVLFLFLFACQWFKYIT